MKFINMFLIGYFVLIFGVGLALWQSGVLARVAPIWIFIGIPFLPGFELFRPGSLLI